MLDAPIEDYITIMSVYVTITSLYITITSVYITITSVLKAHPQPILSSQELCEYMGNGCLVLLEVCGPDCWSILG